MPLSSKPPPLPLAPDRAALSNKISLLLSNRTSLLKTLNPPSSAQQATRRHKVSADDIEQLFSGPRPNEGVGYVADRKAAAGDAAARQDRMLRGRLLGGQRKDGRGKKVAVESESDEEPGRSGLGKRKRPRREVEEVEEGEELGKEEVEDEETGHVEEAAAVLQQEVIADSNAGDDAKRNKKKKKRQREKEKQKQKKLGNTSSQ
ncbi:hypothetical protein THARTR1_00849 [Trichoderma harzianum]|uniref:Uncharacterized protein n=1 Tax=Trichoderma harzianum TaxID=5544 RepID=A0A2K0UNJ7_TRIHA|nr:hypothetical protein THARTR1_00849 [Trichoderma harzianum]